MAAVVGAALGAVFVPSSASALPDQRAYELVSPAQKNGGDVAPDGRRTHVAADGSAASFISLAGFGDVRGTGASVEYLAQRSALVAPGDSGWVTHAIIPPQDAMASVGLLNGAEPAYWLMTSDLSRAVLEAWSPLTSDAAVANVVNLYLRTDLRSGDLGSYDLLTGCPLCATTGPLPPLSPDALPLPIPYVAGASSDLSHVLFESTLALTADVPPCAPDAASGCVHLYESDNGTVRLVGILPDGTPAARSMAGVGAGASHGVLYTPHVMSDDGRRAIFTVPDAAGSLRGDVYERVDGGTPDALTLKLNASERTDCADHDPCSGTPEPDPGGPRPALYQDASVDGTRVFFTSAEALTDATGGGLYEYDTTKPAGQRLTLLGGWSDVVAVSDDGSYVYGGPTDLSLMHDGTTTFVGAIANNSDSAELIWPVPWNAKTARQVRITPDGRHLLFISRSGDGMLSAHGGVDVDQSACPDDGFGPGCRTFYLYNADTDSLQCVSCDAAGRSTAPATDWIRGNVGATFSTPKLSHALSDDGKRVFFMTAQALVPEDVNGKVDVYEFDAETGRASLISSGTSTSDSYFMDASPQGDDVFFTTRERLSGWDTDDNVDLYDARQPHPGHPAGFPEPSPVVPVCTPDCRGQLAAPPSASTPASATLVSSGNVHPARHRARGPARRCRRGRVRQRVHGKVRCVRKPVKHARGAQRAIAGKGRWVR